jgi:hypothetical protein
VCCANIPSEPSCRVTIDTFPGPQCRSGIGCGRCFPASDIGKPDIGEDTECRPRSPPIRSLVVCRLGPPRSESQERFSPVPGEPRSVQGVELVSQLSAFSRPPSPPTHTHGRRVKKLEGLETASVPCPPRSPGTAPNASLCSARIRIKSGCSGSAGESHYAFSTAPRKSGPCRAVGICCCGGR